jgi:hypothetical protein
MKSLQSPLSKNLFSAVVEDFIASEDHYREINFAEENHTLRNNRPSTKQGMPFFY